MRLWTIALPLFPLLNGVTAAAARETSTQPAVKALAEDQIDRRVQERRTADVTLTVTDAAGHPLADAEVAVRQTRHKFLFGCNSFTHGRCRTAEDNAAYDREFSELLNYATLPFYWNAYEQREGLPQRDGMTKMAEWFRDHGIRTKGHPLCWHQSAPGWLARRPATQVEALQLGRVTREVTGFAGMVDTWDVVNEAVVLPDHRPANGITELAGQLGRVELVKRAFAAARQANPKAVLLLNDYDTSPRYEKLIRDCLAAGVPIDVIGIQSHMHVGYWGAAQAWEVCERFTKFGKPLHFTELTILSGKLKTDSDWSGGHPGWDTTPEGENRQAEQATEFYRVLFSHPAVEAVTWWDFSDQGAWQGAPAGLVRKDMTPKPAYLALHKLIKETWWTGPLKLKTDAAGQVRFRGFLGDYAVESVAPAGRGTFTLGLPGPSVTTACLK